MKAFSRLLIPVALSMVALSVIVLILPDGAAASNDQGYGPEEIIAAQGCLFCNRKDIQLSSLGGKLPEVAANGSFVALAYEQSNSVFLRAVQQNDGEWHATSTAVDATNGGNTPKLAFDAVATDTVHVVWTGFNPGANQAIRHAACTLTTVSASCTVHTISTTVGSSFFNPAIAVQSTNRLHVAWFDSALKKIKTAYSDNGGASWTLGTVDISITGSSGVGKPALSVSGSNVHLAFIDNDGAGTPGDWRVKYRRLVAGHTASDAAFDYGPAGVTDVFNFSQIDNVDVSATGVKVYLVWDNRSTAATNKFGLTGAENGSSGLAGGWTSKPLHITSTNPANPTEPANNRKISKDSSTPAEEVALRPSLAISAGNFAVAWQERPSAVCDFFTPENSSSEIYFADNSANGWATWGTLTDTTVLASLSEYSVDPDIAVDNSGTHVVFMKDDNAPGCNGGEQGEFAVFYRGPFQGVKKLGTFLPIIMKNS